MCGFPYCFFSSYRGFFLPQCVKQLSGRPRSEKIRSRDLDLLKESCKIFSIWDIVSLFFFFVSRKEVLNKWKKFISHSAAASLVRSVRSFYKWLIRSDEKKLMCDEVFFFVIYDDKTRVCSFFSHSYLFLIKLMTIKPWNWFVSSDSWLGKKKSFRNPFVTFIVFHACYNLLRVVNFFYIVFM